MSFDRPSTNCFNIRALPQFSVMAAIIDAFALYGAAPKALSSRRLDDGAMTVCVHVEALEVSVAEMLNADLRALDMVRDSWVEHRFARQA